MQIKEFKRKHFEKLLEIEEASFVDEEKIIAFDPKQLKRMIYRMSSTFGRVALKALKVLGREPFKIFVAEFKGRAVGFAIISLRQKTCYISRVMVHRDFQGRGIGTLLTKKALDYVRHRAHNVICHIRTTNVYSKKMVEKLGFEPFERLVFLSAKINSLAGYNTEDGAFVRDFKNADGNTIRKLVMISSGSPFCEDERGFQVSLFERLFRSVLLMPADHKMVLVKNKVINGYAKVRYVAQKVTRLENLHTFCRNSGIEKTLVLAIANKMKNAGKETIIAVIPSNRTDLLESIREIGFEEIFTMEGMTLAFEDDQ